MGSPLHFQLKLVIRIDSCAESENEVNFLDTLDDILRKLDNNDITVHGLCFDAAAQTAKKRTTCSRF